IERVNARSTGECVRQYRGAAAASSAHKRVNKLGLGVIHWIENFAGLLWRRNGESPRDDRFDRPRRVVPLSWIPAFVRVCIGSPLQPCMLRRAIGLDLMTMGVRCG